MTNNKWLCGLSLVVAMAAIAFWRWETRTRGVAEIERDRIQHALAAARMELRSVADIDRAGTPSPKTNDVLPAVVPLPATASVASSPVPTRDNVAAEKARRAAIAEALVRQRVRRMMILEMNVRPKFQSLGLSEAQWNRYQILSLEKVDREEEAKRTRKAGQTPEEMDAVVRAAGGEILAEIKALIGENASAELARFQSERSEPARKTVESLANRLMFSNAPLESWQVEKLREMLRIHSSAPSGNGAANEISNDLSLGVRSVLTPLQLEYWRRFQIEQARLTEAAAMAKRLESAKNAPIR